MEHSSFDPYSNEDAYFLQKDAEARQKLREKLNAAASASAADPVTPATTSPAGGDGVAGGAVDAMDDEALAGRLHTLGLGGDGARVIHLLPMVQVAWAGGEVTRAERNAIVKAAREHGILPDSQAGRLLAAVLEHKPSSEFFRELDHLLIEMVRRDQVQPDGVLELCRSVAKASGGVLGFGNRISVEEEVAIGHFERAMSEAKTNP